MTGEHYPFRGAIPGDTDHETSLSPPETEATIDEQAEMRYKIDEEGNVVRIEGEQQ